MFHLRQAIVTLSALTLLSWSPGTVSRARADLLVASRADSSIKRYNQATGAFQGNFVAPGSGGLIFPENLLYGLDGNLYVSDFAGSSALRYDGRTGAFLDTFVLPGSGGLSEPRGITFGPDGNLYVSSFSSILRYDGQTGDFLGTFASGFPDFNSVLLFGPDGHLYVNRVFGGVLRFDGLTGALIDTFIPAGSGGLTGPRGMIIGPDKNFYIADADTSSVKRFDGATGAFLDTFVSSGSGGLNSAADVVFGPDGNLYVASFETSSVLRYDGTTGTFLSVFVSSGSGGLGDLRGITFTSVAEDADGDGVLNDEDECPNSALSATVVIDGCDSEVTNTVFPSGCTLLVLMSSEVCRCLIGGALALVSLIPT
jgi:DNA-binding beta-propeller fold protein YncE